VIFVFDTILHKFFIMLKYLFIYVILTIKIE